MATKKQLAEAAAAAASTAAAKLTTAVAATGQRALAVTGDVIDFEQDAGRGMESAGKDDFAIPFLSVLQKGSPQVDEASGVAIEGARSGMLFENISGRMFDGKAGVLIVPCAYRRTFIHWGPRTGEGAGFKGEVTPEEVARMRDAGKIVEFEGRLYAPMPDGTINEKRCDRYSDTRSHYSLLVDEDSGTFVQVLISMSSTQIKKSRALNSALAQLQLIGSGGMPYTPPTYASFVRATSVPEQNEKGTWHGWKFALAGTVDRKDLFAAARAFHKSVAAGEVKAKYDDEPAAAGGGGGGGGEEGGGNF